MVWPEGEEQPGERLLVDYWEGIRQFAEAGEPIGFNLPYGEWIALFRKHGFAIEDLIELRPAADATSSYRSESTTANGRGAGRWSRSGGCGCRRPSRQEGSRRQGARRAAWRQGARRAA